MKSIALLLGLLWAVLMGTQAWSDALPPPVVPQCVGVNIHFTGAPARDLDGLAGGRLRLGPHGLRLERH